LRTDFEGREALRLELTRAPKFGNDDLLADGYADLAVRMFHDSLARHKSLRGGDYVPGFYSVTCHIAFGAVTGALPSGRNAGEPFGNGIGPSCGADRSGPTALLNSVSSLDSSLMPNGNAGTCASTRRTWRERRVSGCWRGWSKRSSSGAAWSFS
jgi:pyruvate-formate lyase